MSRQRVEAIFGAGPGCEYERYTINGVRCTGRQYRGANGQVSIRYKRRPGGVERVVPAKRWNTISWC